MYQTMPKRKPLRIGMVGYGFMGRAHSNAYRRVNNFFDLEYEPVLQAVCARDQAKARELTDRFPLDELNVWSDASSQRCLAQFARGLGHRSPKLLVVGQDFGNVGYFVRCRGRDEPDNKTNVNLYRLLRAARLAVGHPSRRDNSTPVFLTNSCSFFA